jgi:hypothetical protein
MRTPAPEIPVTFTSPSAFGLVFASLDCERFGDRAPSELRHRDIRQLTFSPIGRF